LQKSYHAMHSIALSRDRLSRQVVLGDARAQSGG
jgi:hypothetical protein